MYDNLKKYIVWLPFVLLFVLVLGWFLLRDNGSGAEQVRDKLDEAAANQHYITTQIDESAKQAGELREEIGSARKQIAEIANDQRTAGEIIADSQRILREVRTRK